MASTQSKLVSLVLYFVSLLLIAHLQHLSHLLNKHRQRVCGAFYITEYRRTFKGDSVELGNSESRRYRNDVFDGEILVHSEDTNNRNDMLCHWWHVGTVAAPSNNMADIRA